MDGAPHLIGLELGGTKCIAVLARGRVIIERRAVPTGAPQATLDRLEAIARGWASDHPVAGIGIGSFGPLARAPGLPGLSTFGRTPKPGWSDLSLRTRFAGLGAPVAIDTDVAAAALAEHRWGARAGAAMLVYLTVGTGVGGAILVDGIPLHGVLHPEIGHMRVRRPAGDSFAGVCPFHGDCLEGLASGPSILARTGEEGSTLAPGHPAWAAVADALAEACATLILTLSPDHILLGGGVGCGAAFPIENIRLGVLAKLGGYVAGLDEVSVAGCVERASLGPDAGPLGTVALAELAAQQLAVNEARTPLAPPL